MITTDRSRGPGGCCDTCYAKGLTRIGDYLIRARRLRPIDGTFIVAGFWSCEEHLSPELRDVLRELAPEYFSIAGDAGRGDRQTSAGSERVTMQTAYTNCDFCKQRIMPGSWHFRLRAGTCDDVYARGQIKDACSNCVMDQDRALLASSDFNVIEALRAPSVPAIGA